MNVTPIGMGSSAAFSIMQNNNALMNLTRNAGDGSSGDLSAVHQSEKSLLLNNVQNNLIYNAASLAEEAQKKQQDENIKRSFSAFG